MKKRIIAVMMASILTAGCMQPAMALAAEDRQMTAIEEGITGDSADDGAEDKTSDDREYDVYGISEDAAASDSYETDGSEIDDPQEETESDEIESLASTGEMYAVEGVVGGKVQFDKSIGTVTWMQNTVTQAVIPDTIDGVKVVAIGDWATPQKETFTKLVLPDSVTSIGQGLGQYSGLTEVVIPSGVSVISKYSFRGCNSLVNLTVPGNVKTIEDCCFMNCKSLKTVTLEEGVSEVCQNAFQGCSEMVTLSMPSSLKTIGNYAFRYCDILEFVTYGGKDFYPFDGGVKGLTLGDFCFQGAYFGHPDFSDSYKTGKWYKQLHQVTPTGDYVTDIMAIAESQLGYHEGNSLSQMDGVHKGSDNYAEYVYWWNEPGEMWCGEYAAWCLAMASVPYEVVEPKYQTKDKNGDSRKFAWTDTVYAGGAANYGLTAGDVILFKYSGGNHVVIVKSVSIDGDTVTVETLNGNHSNDVSYDTYEIDASTGKTTNEWVKKNGYVDTIYAPDYSFISGLTYYTVSFDMQGGTASWNSKKLTNNASYGLMPFPVKSGYTFDGWYTQPSGGQKITSYRRVRLSSNQTLYAHWTEGEDPVKPDDPVKPVDPDAPDYSDWRFDEATGTITRIPYDWEGGAIPSAINGVTVKAIGDSACSYRDNITSVTIPASVKSIERYAFNGCYELENVIFLGDVSKIKFGRGVFQSTLFMRSDFSAAYKSSEYYKKLMSVDLTGDYIKDAIAIAASQDQYHEGNSVSEMDGTNLNGKNDYAEMAYFTCSPSYKWWPYEEEQYQYGGWCGNFCNWCLSMASIPTEIHGWWELKESECPKWSDTVYAGGAMGYKLKAGDVLKMNIGHYCLVTGVRQEGDIVYVDTWNGNHNNNVCFETYELRASDGYNVGYARDYPSKSQDNGERYQIKWIEPYLPENISKATFYNVKFDANGGTLPAGKSTRKYADSAYYGIMPIPEKEGSRFDGWYTAAEGGRKMTAYHKTLLTSDITLYAHWSETVKIDSSGSGLDPNPQMEISGTEVNVWLIPGQSVNIGAGSFTVKEKSVATVTNAGLVTGKSKGTTSVTGKLADGSALTCNVTVAAAEISEKTAKVLVGSCYRPLTLNITGAESSHYNVSWTSANPMVATVDRNGVVQGISKGSAVISAWTGGKAFTCKVSVVDDVSALNPKTVQFGGSYTINPFKAYAPKYMAFQENVFNTKGATWYWCDDPEADYTSESIVQMDAVTDKKGKTVSYKNDVVEVNATNGKLTATGMGTTVLWGISADEKQFTKIVVNVVTTPTKANLYLLSGKSAALGFKGVKAADATWEKVTEDVDGCEGCDPDCIEFEQKNGKYTGKVNAAAECSGCCNIRCTYKGFTWETKVCVENPALAVSGSLKQEKGTNYSLKLNTGEDYAVSINGIYQTPVWKSSKPAVAFIDENGVIYARGKGSSVITTKIDGKAFKITVTVM